MKVLDMLSLPTILISSFSRQMMQLRILSAAILLTQSCNLTITIRGKFSKTKAENEQKIAEK